MAPSLTSVERNANASQLVPNTSPKSPQTPVVTTATETTSTDTTVSRPFLSETDRLQTFDNWNVSFLDKERMAAAGFRHLAGDIVKCVFCEVEIGNWEEGDDPVGDHRHWSPSCPFMRGLPVGNIPRDPQSAPVNMSRARDVCGLYETEIRPNSASETASSSGTNEGILELDKLGIHRSRAPSYPKYSTYEARLASFEGWPLAIKQRPDKLSEAGFFYTGKGDQTICFHCGGGLKDWEESDDPWEEHALWFSKCLFMILIKGKDFIDGICKKKDAIISAKDAKNLTLPSNLRDSVKIVENQAPSTSAAVEPSPVINNSNTKDIDDARMCKICFQEELGVVFLPCGHFVACVKCAPSLATCAVCRQPFTATVRAFLT